MVKIDLHTHSSASRDGGIKPGQYKSILDSGRLDCIAITDHDTVETALQLQKSLGKQIIVGEEITTTEGELIGLFLSQAIAPGQTPRATAEAIKLQGGLVYAPHPFEKVRKGLSVRSLDHVADLLDIVEAVNGRAVFQNRGPEAANWASMNHKVTAASSDAHGQKGLGTTYTQLTAIPTAKTLVSLLAQGQLVAERPPLRTLLYPKANRLKRKLGRT